MSDQQKRLFENHDNGRARLLKLRDSKPPVLGERVIVLGYPFGKELGREITVTEGLISSIRNLPNDTWYQISTSVNPGNSGGPCLDLKGRVIGIVTKKLKEAESIGFVRPIHDTLAIRQKAKRLSDRP